MFVITIVPLVTASGNVYKSMDNFRYLGGGDFTGRVFCSTLEGEFVKAFGYTNGQLNGTLVVMKRSELEKHKDEEWSQNYSSINLMEGVHTRAGTYVFDEGGGSSGLCPHGYPENSCSICLDEVIVTGCRYCHMQNGCVCERCFYCGKKEPECICMKCIRCGNKMQDCICYLYPDPHPNPDPNPGGGGGGGGGGGITPPPDPDPGTGSGNSGTNTKKHLISSTDQLARADLATFKRRAQRGNTCVPTVMEYISKLVNNGNNYNRKEVKKYFQNNRPSHWKPLKISRIGVPTTMIPGGMYHCFGSNILGKIAYGSNPFDYKSCINSGNIVMTNVQVKNNSGINIGWHNLLIIGYTQSGNYIYIDPNDSSNFYECPPSYLQSNNS